MGDGKEGRTAERGARKGIERKGREGGHFSLARKEVHDNDPVFLGEAKASVLRG